MNPHSLFTDTRRNLLLCLLVLLPSSSFGYELKITSSSPDIPYLYETSLEIDCFVNETVSAASPHTENDLVFVDEIRVVKQNDKKAWVDLASIRVNGHIEYQSTSGFSVAGNIGKIINDTFLSLEWKSASSEQIGLYRCDLIGRNKVNDFVLEKSNLLSIKKHEITTEELADLSLREIDTLQDEFDKFRKDTNKYLSKLYKSVQELRNKTQSQDNNTIDSGGYNLDFDKDQLKKEIQENVLNTVLEEVQEMTCSRVRQCMSGGGEGYFANSSNWENTANTTVSPSSDNRTVSDKPNITDSAASFGGDNSTVSDKPNITDSAPSFWRDNRTVSDKTNITDAAPSFGGDNRTVSYKPNITDSAPSFGGDNRTVSYKPNITDSAPSFGGDNRTVSDKLNITDSAPSFGGDNRTVSNKTNITDSSPSFSNNNLTVPVESFTNVSKPDPDQVQTTAAPNTLNDDITIFSSSWPAGEFGLLRPISDCPADTASIQWRTGYNKYHTESVDENQDAVSNPNHLYNPVSVIDNGKHFLYMHFCVNKDPNPDSRPWPAGSYCINQGGRQCPLGFTSGYVDIDEEDTNFAGSSFGFRPRMLFYCCRNDATADQPISLPTTKPFYLYRFGGKCQEVQNMQVTSESMTFDTENDDNEDAYENDYHPDGQLRNVVIELCYYF
ncbi:Apextrin [Plakobranchus ocellatus]|uniref:Apextrin n=1 Tax=Plakobranchus ocellatus TaxID=259542 RepID=A0AAV4BH67_9GAST|nr:Apextrin [Plakobranchus ocellatus]